MKATHKIKKASFKFKGAHIAITSLSQGGAASMKNESYLFKSNSTKKLSKEELEILAAIGEEFTPLDKKLGSDNQTPLSSEKSVTGDNKTLDEGKEMLDKEFEELRKELELTKALNAELLQKQKEKDNAEKAEKLSKFDFNSDLVKSLSDTLFDLPSEAFDVILKSFESLAEAKEVAISKALEAQPTELAKSLTTEIGETGVPVDKSMSLAEGIASFRKQNKEGK